MSVSNRDVLGLCNISTVIYFQSGKQLQNSPCSLVLNLLSISDCAYLQKVFVLFLICHIKFCQPKFNETNIASFLCCEIKFSLVGDCEGYYHLGCDTVTGRSLQTFAIIYLLSSSGSKSNCSYLRPSCLLAGFSLEPEMETLGSFKTSEILYHVTRLHILEDILYVRQTAMLVYRC